MRTLYINKTLSDSDSIVVLCCDDNVIVIVTGIVMLGVPCAVVAGSGEVPRLVRAAAVGPPRGPVPESAGRRCVAWRAQYNDIHTTADHQIH